MPLNTSLRASRLRRTPARMRGLSLVELMVGVAVGMFVVAAAALLVSSQLFDNRGLLLETQLQQDLRATADIISREMRRSGYWSQSWAGVAKPTGSAAAGDFDVLSSPTLALSVVNATAYELHYRYEREPDNKAFGFKLGSDQVLRACQSNGSEAGGFCDSGWQDVTDPNTVKVIGFLPATDRAGLRAKPANDDPIKLPCPNLCSDGTTDCWPTVTVREIAFTLEGEARSDPRVRRKLESSVRVRNDSVQLSSEATPGRACPGT
jgi:hypothetical protein